MIFRLAMTVGIYEDTKVIVRTNRNWMNTPLFLPRMIDGMTEERMKTQAKLYMKTRISTDGQGKVA